MKKLLWMCAVVCLLVSVTSAQTSPLAQLAASMAPGTLVELTGMNGFQTGSTYIVQTGAGSVLEYADKGVWDSITKRFMFFGESHYGDPPPSNRFIQYDDLTNTWSELSRPPSGVNGTGLSHTYEHNAIDVLGRTYFYLDYGSAVVETRNLDTGAWSTLPANNLPEYNQCCRAIEWFPEMNGLVWLANGESSGSGVFIWKRSTNQWERLASNLPTGYISGFASYDPVHHVVLLGGGYDHPSTAWDDSKVFYKLDATGTLTRLPDAPVRMGVNLSVNTVDPITGELLVLGKTWTFHGFDVAANAWTVRNSAIAATVLANPYFPNDWVFNVVAAPISTYGVTMFVKLDHQNVGKVFIYKHAGGSPPPPPPPTNTAPVVQPLTDQTIQITEGQTTATTTLSASVSDDGLPNGTLTGSWSGTNVTFGAPTATTTTATAAAGAYPITYTANDSALQTSQSMTLTVNAPAPPPPPGSTFTQKCAQSGVLACWGFDNPSELKYVWDLNDPDLNAIMAGQTWYPLGSSRSSGEGNTVVIKHQSGAISKPIIDAGVFSSGGGSLRFNMPSLSGANPGWFQDNINKVLGNPSVFIAPGSPLGNVIYVQYRVRPNDAMMLQFRDEGGGLAGGWKTDILFGNAPNGSSSSSIEVATMHPRGLGFPVMYGQSGFDDYGWQDVRMCGWQWLDPSLTYNPALFTEPPCKKFKPNQFAEITKRVEIRGAPNAAESRVQLWVDGELAVDYGNARVNYSSTDGAGIGQVMLTPYTTRKDPTEVHPEGLIWYDDVIVSTQPIAMGGSAAPPPPPPPPDPCVVSPLVVTVTQWPTSRTGSRQDRWASPTDNTKELVERVWKWPIGGNQSATFKDERGCTVTVNKP